MGRGFLMALLALDLLVIASSAYVLWDRVRAQMSGPMETAAAVKAPAIPEPAPKPPAEIAPAPKPREPAEPAAGRRAEVSFSFRDPRAKTVAVTGEFNGWKPEDMKKDERLGWALKVSLPPGKYAYNFIVDGKMIRDPANKESGSLADRKVPASVLVVQ